MLRALQALSMLALFAHANVASAEVLTYQVSGQPFAFAGSLRHNTKIIEAVSWRLSAAQPLLIQKGLTVTPRAQWQGELIFIGSDTFVSNQFDLGLSGSAQLGNTPWKVDLRIDTTFTAETFSKPHDWPVQIGSRLSLDLQPGTFSFYSDLRLEASEPSLVVGVRYTIPLP